MEMLNALRELCSFQSIAERTGDPAAPYGREVNAALRRALAICEEFGFRTKNCGERIGWAEIGRGDEIFGILVHLDVVPAGSGWDYEPFSATRSDGKIFGRGVTDDKGPAVACIYAMRDLLLSGVPLKRRIRIIFGQTEETGEWEDMEYYRQTEELPAMGFTPDADFPAIYGEKGIAICSMTMPRERAGLLRAAGGQAPNMVPDEAWAEMETADGVQRLETRGVAAHGSTPEDGKNAISLLMAELAEKAPNCAFAKFYNDCIGFDLNGGRMGIPLEDGVSGRLTMNAGMLCVTEETVELAVDIRYPVTSSLLEVTEGMKPALSRHGVTLTVKDHMAPVYMKRDGELITKLTEVYRRVTGRAEEPSVMGGGTYARAMENIVAFGPMLPGRELTEHQKNEYILEEDFNLLREVYREALKEVCSCDC